MFLVWISLIENEHVFNFLNVPWRNLAVVGFAEKVLVIAGFFRHISFDLNPNLTVEIIPLKMQVYVNMK